MEETVTNMSSMIAVDDVAEAAKLWSALLGVAPTFIDGDRWAQFDVNGTRLALAGTDRVSDRSGIMLKAVDIAEIRVRAIAAGLDAGAIVETPHEWRCIMRGPGDCPIVAYAPKR